MTAAAKQPGVHGTACAAVAAFEALPSAGCREEFTLANPVHGMLPTLG
jgi:hypothetical protein